MDDLNDFLEELELNGDLKELKKIKRMRDKWEYNRLRNSVIKELETILNDIKNEEYKNVESRIIWSPAGDGMGTDNYTFKATGRSTKWRIEHGSSDGDLPSDIMKLVSYKKDNK